MGAQVFCGKMRASRGSMVSACCRRCVPPPAPCCCGARNAARSSTCTCANADPAHACFGVSRQMRLQAYEVSFTSTPLRLEYSLEDIAITMKKLPRVGLQHVRCLHLDMSSDIVPWRFDRYGGYQLWDAVLARIVECVPLATPQLRVSLRGEYCDIEELENELEERRDGAQALAHVVAMLSALKRLRGLRDLVVRLHNCTYLEAYAERAVMGPAYECPDAEVVLERQLVFPTHVWQAPKHWFTEAHQRDLDLPESLFADPNLA